MGAAALGKVSNRSEVDTDGDHVAVRQAVLACDHAVDLGPVRRAEVDDEDRVALATHLGVTARDVRVVESDGALGQAPDRDGLAHDADPRRPSGKTSQAVGVSSPSRSSLVMANVLTDSSSSPADLDLTGRRTGSPRVLPCSCAASISSLGQRRRRSPRSARSPRGQEDVELVRDDEPAECRHRTMRSISRVSRRPSSIGWSWPRNALANAPSTRRSRRCSNCWSPMVSSDYLGGWYRGRRGLT